MVVTSAAGEAFFIARRRPEARLRLVCFPYAGGAPWTYRDWSAAMPEVEVCTACLPGRGARFREPHAVCIEAVIDAFADHVATALDDKPFALFGHSFGALLAVAVAQALQGRGGPSPLRVFVSACAVPGRPTTNVPVCTRGDEELVAMLRTNIHVPDTVREDPALFAMALAALRADFALAAGFLPSPERLRVPVTAYAGDGDAQAPAEAMRGWQAFAVAPLDLQVLPGGHFFLHERPEPLLASLRRTLGLSPRGTP